MYNNVGMANREKRPKQERDDIRFTHIAIPTSFYVLFCNIEVCVLLEHVLISYTGGVCYLYVCWKQASVRWESSESLMPVVDMLHDGCMEGCA